MQTLAKILKYSDESIKIVVDSLLSGNVVALPTETVYGLGGIINSDIALRKIFEVKSRPFIDPLIVHVLNNSSFFQLVDIDSILREKIEKLIDAFCPGPLTFVLNKQKHVSDLITAGKKTVAIRIPQHRAFRHVLREICCPIAAPSANPFGYLSPTCAEHVFNSLGNKIEYILDGGHCEFGVESTILDCSGKKMRILRPGAVSADEISQCLNEEILPYKSITTTDPSAPGMLKQHYSPQTKLRLFETHAPDSTNNLKCAYIFLSRKDAENNGTSSQFGESNHVFWLSESGDFLEIAQNLFSLLHILDLQNYDMIYCQTPENIGIGTAIRDRLTRAAAKF